jgi:hypothetical protein
MPQIHCFQKHIYWVYTPPHFFLFHTIPSFPSVGQDGEQHCNCGNYFTQVDMSLRVLATFMMEGFVTLEAAAPMSNFYETA